MAEAAYLSIGEVLGILLEEFPDVTISKIRFLESQGLIEPERTPSGYRKFYDNDVDLLRAILREQKDNFLPLKVIRDRIESGAIEPDATGSHTMPRGIRNVDITQSLARPAPVRPAPVVRQAPPAIEPAAATPVPSAANAAPARDSVFRRTDVPAEETPAVSEPEVVTPHAVSSPVNLLQEAATVDVATPEPEPEPVPAQAPIEIVTLDPAPAEPEPTPIPIRPLAPTAIAASNDDLVNNLLLAAEVCAAAGISSRQLGELEQYGVVVARGSGTNATYDTEALHLATLGGKLMALGVDARHLRSWKVSAEREAALFEQLVTPLLRQRNPQSRRKAFESLNELSDLGGELRSALMVSLLRSYDQTP